jgi:hypothetical protein
MNDDLLRQAFAELRRVEAEQAPKFHGPHVEPALSRLRSRLRVGSTLAFVVVLLIIVVLSFRRPPEPSISAWKAPTDFLLATPGRELLQSTPDLKGIRR